MIRKVMPAQATELEGGRTRVVASTNQLARDGHILEPAGLMTENFLRCGTILFDHDPQIPVGVPAAAALNAEGSLTVDVEWAPEGISTDADRVRGLVKSGIIRAVSIGFDPVDMEPLDKQKPRGGQHIFTADLLELSFVSIPADTGAVVTQRSDPKHEETSGMAENRGNDTHRALAAKHARALARAPKKPVFKRGLCEVASLAYMLHQLGYAHDCSEYEAAIEGDSSPVPGMLGEALEKLGETLKAMAAEEVDELMEEVHGDGDEDEGDAGMERDLPDTERAFVAGAKTPRARAWRRGIALARAGRALNASNQKKLEEAENHHERALKHHKAATEHQEATAEALETAQDAHAKATKAHGELGEAIDQVKNDFPKATEHVARMAKLHKQVAQHQLATGEAQENMSDSLQDVGDSHQGIGRSIKSAQRCVRAVVDGSTPGAEDGDTKEIQTADGDGESEGSKNDRSVTYRRRQADLLRLAAT